MRGKVVGMVYPDELLYETAGVVHSCIQVRQRGSVRYLRFGASGGWQGAIRCVAGARPVFAYQRAFAALVESRPELGRFLALGVGTGTALRTVLQIHPTCAPEGVDIDQTVIELALQYFDAPEPGRAQYYVHDAVLFCDHAATPYDLVFVDVYRARSLDARILSEAFVERLRRITVPGGAVVCNIIDRMPATGALAEFARAARERFGHVWVLPVGSVPSFLDQNLLWVMSDRSEDGVRWRERMRTSHWVAPWERVIWPMRIRSADRVL
ncbi:spermidine synthase [Alicyclobacillus sp.]|uniref:spermidine synthase n=1 Tax=Alicyclobacillus sp. TaxID=61169 RepID=UPI0025C415BD|nr:spermidine synthase [Alicyclobacillus sp.]MCL6515763.1 spermidine synthase [Alicyclobacillus sp.]